MVNSTFYFLYGQVDFLFGQVDFWYGQLFAFDIGQRKTLQTGRLQTGSEVQTECKMQTEDCRPDQG